MSQQYKVTYDSFQVFQEKFIIGEEIGFGSFGSVKTLKYKDLNQIQQENNEELVVKQLKCSDGKKLFQENEIQSLKKIQLLPDKYKKRFLNIKCVNWDSKNEIINMVIPRAKNSLHQEINIRYQNQKFYTQEELYFKLSCALEGLFTLETLGMVHRDIKADNLLIMKDGSLVIADLGTAKKLQYQIQQMTIGVGTYSYWPPEQIDTYLKLKNQDYLEYLKSPEANKNFKTNDLYGIGLCIIRASNLSYLPNLKKDEPNFLEIYKNEREKWLEDQFKQLNKKFDKQFVSLLEKMVSKDYRYRYSLLQCAETLCKIWNIN